MINGITDISSASIYSATPAAPVTPVAATEPVESMPSKVQENSSSKQDSSNDKPVFELTQEEQDKKFSQLQQVLESHDIQISYNDKVNRYAISVIDSDTREVIKEIPSEKMLEMFENMLELKGMLVDESR